MDHIDTKTIYFEILYRLVKIFYLSMLDIYLRISARLSDFLCTERDSLHQKLTELITLDIDREPLAYTRNNIERREDWIFLKN